MCGLCEIMERFSPFCSGLVKITTFIQNFIKLARKLETILGAQDLHGQPVSQMDGRTSLDRFKKWFESIGVLKNIFKDFYYCGVCEWSLFVKCHFPDKQSRLNSWIYQKFIYSFLVFCFNWKDMFFFGGAGFSLVQGLRSISN